MTVFEDFSFAKDDDTPLYHRSVSTLGVAFTNVLDRRVVTPSNSQSYIQVDTPTNGMVGTMARGAVDVVVNYMGKDGLTSNTYTLPNANTTGWTAMEVRSHKKVITLFINGNLHSTIQPNEDLNGKLISSIRFNNFTQVSGLYYRPEAQTPVGSFNLITQEFDTIDYTGTLTPSSGTIENNLRSGVNRVIASKSEITITPKDPLQDWSVVDRVMSVATTTNSSFYRTISSGDNTHQGYVKDSVISVPIDGQVVLNA